MELVNPTKGNLHAFSVLPKGSHSLHLPLFCWEQKGWGEGAGCQSGSLVAAKETEFSEFKQGKGILGKGIK